MGDVIVWDNILLGRNSYGGDLRLLDSVLSATGFESINFKPVNVDLTTAHHGRHKRRKVARGKTSHPHGQRIECGSCAQTFSVKKSRDRHRDSVHNQQEYRCLICHRVFTRKDMRNRHQAEKHGGRRRPRPNVSKSCVANDVPPDNFEAITCANDNPLNDQRAGSTSAISTSSNPTSSMNDQDVGSEEADEEIERPPSSPTDINFLGHIDLELPNNALLLCTDLLIRCKPYKRYFVHNKKRDIISRKKWRSPAKDVSFCALYDSAVRTLRFQLAFGKNDAELLAAIAAFGNVDVLINGAERMGYHARAMYALKAHHRSRRDPIFDALETAFLSLGRVCRSIRIIYTKQGFVWMLNVSCSINLLSKIVPRLTLCRWVIDV